MNSDNALAGASDTTGLPLDKRRAEEAVEVMPVVMYGKTDVPEVDDNLYDFTPIAEEEIVGLEDVEEDGDAVGPKDWSAQNSALYAIYEQVKSPSPVMPKATESNAELETPASADKDSIEDEANLTGSATG